MSCKIVCAGAPSNEFQNAVASVINSLGENTNDEGTSSATNQGDEDDVLLLEQVELPEIDTGDVLQLVVQDDGSLAQDPEPTLSPESSMQICDLNSETLLTSAGQPQNLQESALVSDSIRTNHVLVPTTVNHSQVANTAVSTVVTEAKIIFFIRFI